MGKRKHFLSAFAGVCMSTAILLAYPSHASAPTLHKVARKTVSLATLHPQQYAWKILSRKGMGIKEYKCLINLWTMESHWNPKAHNPHSTAFGIGQLLIETSPDPAKQIRNGIRYIDYRYGTGGPCKAWAFWQLHYYY